MDNAQFMKPGYTVKYNDNDNDELKNQTGKVVRKIRFHDRELWEVDFRNGIGIRPALEKNLEIVSCQFQLKFAFMEEAA